MRYTITIASLTAVSVIVLLLAKASGGTFSGDLLMNLGATVVGAVVTALILQPVIERAQTPEVIVHTMFPHARFLDAMSTTAGRIKIMGAWPYGMDMPYQDVFLGVLRRAISARIPVQILVLDPASDAARQRTLDMGAGDASENIYNVLLTFKGWVDTLSASAARHFELKVFSALPPARLYLAGNKAICSFFGDSDNRDGSNVRHYETSVLGGLGYYVNDAFDRLWNSTEALLLDQHWRLDLVVQWPEGTEPDFDRYRQVAYVAADGGLFISDQQLLYDTGRQEVPVQLRRRIVGFDWDGHQPLRIGAFDRARDPRAGKVVATANAKYGNENDVRRSFLEIRVVA
ncbi:putative secreted protein [Candidatus Protofrankia californiensis]|uniref:Putative secreted protein n=1 Tax=Candidatus Protofrankia californiensis TaxID=1839754 RepID=A0A1C3PGJ7_9ACTN|nr:putative secreted protein [Candidatus Protofrankia californiensis]